MCPSKSSKVIGIFNAIDMGNGQKRVLYGITTCLWQLTLNVGRTNFVIVEARKKNKSMLMGFLCHMDNNNANKSTQVFVKVADNSNEEELLVGI